MSLGVVLGACALYFVWRRKGDQAIQFRVALVLASLYWITQVAAGFFPGIAFVDPEFAATVLKFGGISLQIALDAVLLGLLIVSCVVRGASKCPSKQCTPLRRGTYERSAVWDTTITHVGTSIGQVGATPRRYLPSCGLYLNYSNHRSTCVKSRKVQIRSQSA